RPGGQAVSAPGPNRRPSRVCAAPARAPRGHRRAALGSVVAARPPPIRGRGAGGAGGAAPEGRRLVAYALVMGLAIAAQLFAGVVLLCHIAWMLTRRSRAELLQLAPAWIGAALVGVAANATIQVTEFTQHGLPAPLFYPTFPRDLVL